MTDPVSDGVIAIYDDQAHAIVDFEKLVSFEKAFAFDAAVAAKSATGEIGIPCSHHAHGSSKVGHGVGAGLAAGLLVALLPGIGLAAAAGGAAVGGAVEGGKDVKLRHDEHDALMKIANDALDDGEALLAVICPPEETERFDQLLTEARRVLDVNVADLPD